MRKRTGEKNQLLLGNRFTRTGREVTVTSLRKKTIVCSAKKRMGLEKQILAGIEDIKSLLANWKQEPEVVKEEGYSISAVKEVVKQSKKFEKEKGEWVEESDLAKYLKGTGWWCSRFIREEFQFTAVIKHGHHFLFNKNALIALNKELKQRRVNLERYIEYKRSEKEFQKKLAANKVPTKGQPLFKIPDNLKDINTSPVPPPSVETVRVNIDNLKKEFFESKMADYIDIYRENHAMLKSMYHFEKYIDPKIKRRCKIWCDNFNYANHALELITKKKEVFIPVKEDEMIQL